VVQFPVESYQRLVIGNLSGSTWELGSLRARQMEHRGLSGRAGYAEQILYLEWGL